MVIVVIGMSVVGYRALKENREMSKADLFSDLTKREIAAILRCDISLIISSYEMNLLIDTFKIDKSILHYLPFMVDLEKYPKQHINPNYLLANQALLLH